MIESTFVAVPLSSSIDQSQIARPVRGRNRLVGPGQIELLDRHSDFFREADPDKSTGGNRISVPYETRRFLCADDFSAVQCLHWRKSYSNWLSWHESSTGV